MKDYIISQIIRAVTALNVAAVKELFDTYGPYDYIYKNELFVDLFENMSCFYRRSNYPLIAYSINTDSPGQFKYFFTSITTIDYIYLSFLFDKNDKIIISRYFSKKQSNYLTNAYVSAFYTKSMVIADPKKIVEYNKLNNLFNAALNELVSINRGFLTKHDYLPWLQKYQSLMTGQQFKKLSEISSNHLSVDIFKYLMEISELFDIEHQACEALEEYLKIDMFQEIDFVKWLVKYEDIGFKIFELYYPYFDVEYKNGYIPVYPSCIVHFRLDDYKNILDFFALFNDPYFTILEIYSDLPFSVFQTLSEEQRKNYSSLKFLVERYGFLQR